MKTATSNGVLRFTAANPCPVCGGSEHDRRGAGSRCHGYLSTDRKFIFCARQEHAGKAAHDAGSNCYRHTARGPCPCGKEHAPADPRPARRGKLGEIDQVYPYHDIDGTVPFEVVRYKNPKDFRQRRPLGGGRYAWSLKGVRTILFKRPQLLRADVAAIVWICEGEKDANNLGAKGEVTTCNPMGAGKGKWREHYRDDLRGRIVVILPHNDQAGRDHAQRVAYSLRGAAASVKVVEIPGLPENGDVSDFLAAGGTVDRLRELARQTPEWTPPVEPIEIEVNEAIDDPHRLARLYRDERCRHRDGLLHHDGLTLRFYRDEYVRWDGSAYRPEPAKEVNAYLNRACKAEFDRANRVAIGEWTKRGEVDEEGKPCPAPQAKKVGTRLVGDTSQALASMTLLPGTVRPPAWLIDDPPFPDPVEVIPCHNALVHIPSLVSGRPAILPPSPAFFNTYALDFDFDPDAPRPAEWIRFLGSLWDKDGESIGTLQEWFGYCLTPDTSQHKILSLIGPKRSGKGTIARVLRMLVGPDNVAGPTLGSLTTNFGLAPLIGKPLAVISDARMSSRTDQAVVVERLLSISGQDALSVDRKHLTAWEGQLPTRFVLISNELPRLNDASGALAGRLILLRLTQSFFGKEDRNLFDRLVPELPGILLWAIEGWRRLRDRGYFVQPDSGCELIQQMEDLSSPVGAFIRDRCEVKPGLEVETKILYEAWKEWCESMGRKEGDSQNFGRNLHAALPFLKTKGTRRGAGGGQVQLRIYVGIGLKVGF
jgi:putative DNA primase/helicase